MQADIQIQTQSQSQAPAPKYAVPAASADGVAAYQLIRRNGHVVPFDPERITVAITKAFLAAEGGHSAASSRVRETVAALTAQVVEAATRRRPGGGSIHIEDVQDQVELALMRAGHHEVARRYVLHREERAQERARRQPAVTPVPETDAGTLQVREADGLRPLRREALLERVQAACAGLGEDVDAEHVVRSALRDLYDGVTAGEVEKCLILAARASIDRDPAYSKVTARLLLYAIRREVLGEDVAQAAMRERYAACFPQLIRRGVEAELLDERLLQFDLETLGAALDAERDLQFGYLGLQTLYDRYFLQVDERRIELPQTFFMRVAMGLALEEPEREARAIEFYRLLSSFDFMSSTPTLFNAGTRHPQLSSCYLTTTQDDLDSIYQSVKENALLQKFAGGLGNDWTPVRALGSHINGTNGRSQGVIPFLKVVNDTAVAVNQGGKRKGAVCAYLETWHLDIEEFLELRKNTGDDRRRTHDMNTANWVPDLFMQRVEQDAEWTLFSPSDVPELHERYGRAFEEAYLACERRGEIRHYKKVPAVRLWRKMLSMLFETGHPWITFKDACNIRSPQRHAGVVHSSNLCTEITLNTSEAESAVCNLGSVNLVNHLRADGFDLDKLRATVATAMRMLDNVIDVNFYPVEKTRRSNLRHRPVGLGIMGFQDCLHALRIPYASEAAVELADRSMEAVCYYAYWASTELAEERGRYPSFAGSAWDQGLLPLDTLELLAEERGAEIEVDRSAALDWDALRARIAEAGMRNSNCIAIAPTATIANIAGVSASIEPTFQNLFVKSNLSGEFTIVNEYLVRDLKRLGLWDEVMINDLKYFNGALGRIDRVPAELRALYATAFEMDPGRLVQAAARRQKWIDQSQSLNLYVAGASGRQLDELYRQAWRSGLKTTYYLRTLAASNAEQSTGRGGELNAVSAELAGNGHAAPACAIDDPDCESCQ